MSTLILEDFKIGLDRRRMNETSLPGSLVVCENAHITRGGEIEKAEALIRFCNLPDNTYGLKAVGSGYMVFGSDNISPTVLNSNPPVRYQRLNDAGGTQAWGSFAISGQVAGDTFTAIKASTTDLITGTSTCPATVANWPSEIVGQINARTGTSGFAAFLQGTNTIVVYAVAVGTAANGFTWTHTKTGSVTVGSVVNFSGGVAATNPSMIEVHCVELFDGLPYVIAEYSDGVIRHWYNGTKVADQFSGKGRAKFSIDADPDLVEAVRATGSFVIIDPADGCSITSILVGAQELLAATVVYDSDQDERGFPVKVIDAINENSNQSGFTAALQGDRKVVITAEIAGSGVNTDAIAVTTAGTITIQDEIAMAGGEDAQQITSITINAVEIMPTDVDWAESNQATAAAVAAAINNNTATSGYEAFSYGSTVLIRKIAGGTAANGHALVVTTDADIDIVDASAAITGGSALPTVVEPGRFAKTVKNKMYTLTGPSTYYSEIGVPNNFDSGIGSGFDNLSNNSSGAEVLVAMADYFENEAFFSQNNIQVWFLSDDPDENQLLQVLNNTGTDAADSVTEFGDNDVFYLSQSGIRSLRARDTTNAAFVNDVGIAIDQLIQAELLGNAIEARKAKGFLEPRQGRFLMAIGETIYVFSFFPSSKISAWSTYQPGFKIDARPAAIGQTVVCRSRNALYKIGSSIERLYDARQVKVITPFMAGEDPSVVKPWSGLDMACQGTWDVYIATDPLRVDEDGVPDEAYFERIGSVTGTTYAETGGENGHVGFDAVSSHIALMFISRSPGYARIGNVAVHSGGAGRSTGEKQ